MNKEIVLDVRDMAPRERHPRIFAAWEALPVGAALKLVNDHDPKPLYYEFKAERSGEFEWTPIERGPDTWSVEIKRVAAAAPSSGAGADQPAEKPAWASKALLAEVDVREDLKAGDEPFPRIMAVVSKARPGDVFVVRAIFDPKPLYELLRAKGFKSWTERLADDDWKAYFHKMREGGCGCGGHGHH